MEYTVVEIVEEEFKYYQLFQDKMSIHVDKSSSVGSTWCTGLQDFSISCSYSQLTGTRSVAVVTGTAYNTYYR